MIDDRLLGEWRGQTLGGDSWNGSTNRDGDWYVGESPMRSETPDTLDAKGRPYITPSARVDDWD